MAKKKSHKKAQVDWVKMAVPHLLAVAAAVMIAGTISVAYALSN